MFETREYLISLFILILKGGFRHAFLVDSVAR